MGDEIQIQGPIDRPTMKQREIAMLAMVIAANPHTAETSVGIASTRGRIVGSDLVVNRKVQQDRNAPCECRSGRKFKKCCGKPKG